MIRTIVVASLLLLTGGTADDATGQPMVVARVEGRHGHFPCWSTARKGSTSAPSVSPAMPSSRTARYA